MMGEKRDSERCIGTTEDINKSICYHLGKAEQSQGRGFELRMSEVLCEDSDVSAEGLETDDWVLPVFWSGGELCLWISAPDCAAFIGYEDETPTLSYYNDTLDRRCSMEPTSEDIRKLVEGFDKRLVLRSDTPFSEGDNGGSQ